MKIFIIGSTSYQCKMIAYKKMMERHGHSVKMPLFDSGFLDELHICLSNIESIRNVDEVHVFWDQRSMGTAFDFGAAMALGKKTKLVYYNKKTFLNVMKWYSDPALYLEERHNIPDTF